ncbi:MAG TPA: flagellar basal body P-ring formation chaperone FlgA [Pirellulales bacterium]|nr:flagellar basal body P-ring formation chaperone FlgA [Pirellulales bacterium]
MSSLLKDARRMRPGFARVVVFLAILLLGSAHSGAAEIQVRSECDASGLVRLGDVAEIHATDPGEAAKLKEIELFPAPSVGGKSFVRTRELQDLLALRGINLSQHRFTGASQVEIRNGTRPSAPLTSSITRRAAERVEAAIAAHLRRQAGKDTDWELDLHLNDEEARVIAATGESLSAAGGQSPWTGEQSFSITVPGESGKQVLTVATKVAAVPLVVVAKRAMVPGDIVQATDVKLGRAKTGDDDLPCRTLDEVVGKETRRAIVEGQAVKEDDLRSPILVRRGDAVHVYARSAGIQVRVDGRAQEDGSRGDLIVVESINANRERFMARVSGIHEVEVFAQPAAAESAAGMRTAETPLRAARPRMTADRRATGFRRRAETAATSTALPSPDRQRQ